MPRSMPSLLPVLLSLAACASSASAQRGVRTGPLWGPLEPGPYAVGFSTSMTVDEDRDLDADRAGRPIRLMVWYPAAPSDAAFLTVGAYFRHPVPADWTAPYHAALHGRDMDVASRQFSPPSDSLRALLLRVPVAASADAEPAIRDAPLVVHAGGRNNFQQEGIALWEYLASHGYAVVVIPQFGPTLERPRVDFTLEDLDTQARDILQAVRAAAEMPFVDASRTAILGHSSGSMAGLIAASRDPRIDLLIGLDGSTTTGEGAGLLDGEPFVEDIAATVVELYAQGKQDRSEALADRMAAAPVHLVGVGGGVPPALATHFDFQMWPVFTYVLEQADERARGARPEALGAAFYWTSARLARVFLEARDRGTAREAVTVASRALPGVELHYAFRPAGR